HPGRIGPGANKPRHRALSVTGSHHVAGRSVRGPASTCESTPITRRHPQHPPEANIHTKQSASLAYAQNSQIGTVPLTTRLWRAPPTLASALPRGSIQVRPHQWPCSLVRRSVTLLRLRLFGPSH